MSTRECQSCRTMIEDNVDTCPNCGWQFTVVNGKGGPVFGIPAVRPKQPCEVQIAFTDDRTGSSDAFKVGIPATVEEILESLIAKARNVKVWFQTHGDLDEGQDTVLLVDGGTPDEAIKAVKTVVYEGGGDPKEHHLDAIEHLATTIPWTADPRKARGAIVAMMTADSKPARSGKTVQQIGEDIRNRGILLYLICEETPQLRALADAANGWLFKISNTPDLKELQKIGAMIGASITVQAGAGATVPLTAPKSVA